MAGYKDYYDIENIIEDFLRKDIIGPIREDEVLETKPTEEYSMGILWPQRMNQNEESSPSMEEEEAIDIPVDSKEDIGDIDVLGEMEEEDIKNDFNKANIFKPSSMAISAVIKKEERELFVDFSFATYTFGYKEIEYTRKKTVDNEEIMETVVRRQDQYTRKKHEPVSLIIDTYTGEIIKGSELLHKVNIQLFVRKLYSDGSRLITVSVLNKAMAGKENVNPLALFQCSLKLKAKEGFLPINSGFASHGELEQEILELLYRDEKNYAVGHGCSVKWQEENNKICSIFSEFLPVEELNQMKPRSIPKIKCFNMTYWIEVDRQLGLKELSEFIGIYEDWLQKLKRTGRELDSYKRAVNSCIEKIELCIRRLRQGAETLRCNESMWKAFVYMNEAMAIQRVNYGKTKGRKLVLEDISWYPFQLAYILQILPDIAGEEDSYRNAVDLLWFPTGGGKTEAYLGLSAITIFYRRLTKGDLSGGVTILMRYTLRLLTAQQFERATALICACEALRRKYKFSSEEISIGLWVGMDLTPNTLLDAKEKLSALRDGDYVYRGNPVQLYRCPYCGEELTLGSYKVQGSLKIQCLNKSCLFSEGLPVYLVDEDIYKVRPTLLLSTIDKLARIVWEEKTLALFAADKANLPPELIIQDELHLISGPLGSLSGLYEIAVDELCTTAEGRGPKIIASTATVRNAVKQIKALYNRETIQFPPNGLSYEDSFFAVMASRDERPARRYIGICETGGNLVDVLIRVYGCVIYCINYLRAKGVRDELIDQYFTLIGYFNTLKDLGSAATILLDHVRIYSTALMLHKFKDYSEEVGLKEIELNFYSELTSRKSSKEIKDTLEELEISYPDERAYSYVLASNMLSVGIDVGRLGIMTVYSQPKTTAEYIQATSRAGRSNPGMIVTFYNSTRTRDRSHYEQFSYYHRTFYKYVEPTSVTPFSFRAIEKALHSVYVALIRHRVKNMSSNEAVRSFDSNSLDVRRLKEKILERIKDINPEALEYASLWLSNFEELWEAAIEEKGETFYYSLKNNDASLVYTLLNEAEKDVNTIFPSVLNSLRNVDGSSNVYIIDREEETNNEKDI